jgi:hypothetical protein
LRYASSAILKLSRRISDIPCMDLIFASVEYLEADLGFRDGNDAERIRIIREGEKTGFGPYDYLGLSRTSPLSVQVKREIAKSSYLDEEVIREFQKDEDLLVRCLVCQNSWRVSDGLKEGESPFDNPGQYWIRKFNEITRSEKFALVKNKRLNFALIEHILLNSYTNLDVTESEKAHLLMAFSTRPYDDSKLHEDYSDKIQHYQIILKSISELDPKRTGPDPEGDYRGMLLNKFFSLSTRYRDEIWIPWIKTTEDVRLKVSFIEACEDWTLLGIFKSDKNEKVREAYYGSLKYFGEKISDINDTGALIGIAGNSKLKTKDRESALEKLNTLSVDNDVLSETWKQLEENPSSDANIPISNEDLQERIDAIGHHVLLAKEAVEHTYYNLFKLVGVFFIVYVTVTILKIIF